MIAIVERSLASVLLALSLSVPQPARAAEPIGSVPGITTRDMGGKRFDLTKHLKEGPAVITFWATWCKPCRKELPELQKLVERYGKQGFQVIAVNGDGPVDAAKIRPFIRARKFDFSVLLDPDGEIKRRFQVEVFPTTFLVDRDRRIVHRQVGYRQGDEKLLDEELRAPLKLEAPEPDAANPDAPR